MTVYLLSISPPLHHAKHYIGYCDDGTENDRLAKHLAGRGAKLIAAAVAAGRTVSLVHTWPGAPRKFERRLKDRKDVPRWCPCCASPIKYAKPPVWRAAA